MPHFFVSPDQITPPLVKISGDTYHHLTSVLRIKPGELINIFDGEGRTFQILVEQVERNCLQAKIVSPSTQEKPPLKIHLFCGIIKGSKMELLLEKATEVGVGEITPMITSRTVVKIKDAGNKLVRWQKIVLSACEQSARAFIPVVNPPQKFSEAINKNNGQAYNILAWEEEDKINLRQAIADYRQNHLDKKTINIFVGPEGGFTPEEADYARRYSAQIISLGKNILRAETASLCLLFVLHYELMD